jgi:hypothetical protein
LRLWTKGQIEKSNINRTQDKLLTEALDPDRRGREDLAVVSGRLTPWSCALQGGGHATTCPDRSRMAIL